LPDYDSLALFYGVELTVKAKFREEGGTDVLSCLTFPVTLYEEPFPTIAPTAAPFANVSSSSSQLPNILIPIAAAVVVICLCCSALMYRDHRRRQQFKNARQSVDMTNVGGEYDSTTL